MAVRVKLNDSGMSLLEVMIANAILIVVFFALMNTATVALRATTEAALQDIAMDIGEMELNDARNTQFSSLVTTAPKTVSRPYRNGTFRFTVTRTATNINADYKLVTIKINWTWKSTNHIHTVNTYVKNG